MELTREMCETSSAAAGQMIGAEDGIFAKGETRRSQTKAFNSKNSEKPETPDAATAGHFCQGLSVQLGVGQGHWP